MFFDLVYATTWLLYRRLRYMAFSLIGRNPLNNEQSLSAEWQSVLGLIRTRSFRPQVETVASDGSTLWKTPLGSVWTPPGMTDYFVSMISREMLSGVYNLESLPKDGVVVDAGANVGFFSLFALQAGAAKVVAFEPSPVTAACLRNNLKPYIDSGRAVVVEKGLWNEDTVLRFSSVNKENPGANRITDSGEIEIATTTLDRVLADLDIPRIHYLKMDIEGAEINALIGGSATLRRDHPVCAIAVEHTDDIIENAVGVVKAMKTITPRYHYFATERHPYQSPSMGLVLTPYALQFIAR